MTELNEFIKDNPDNNTVTALRKFKVEMSGHKTWTIEQQNKLDNLIENVKKSMELNNRKSKIIDDLEAVCKRHNIEIYASDFGFSVYDKTTDEYLGVIEDGLG